MQLQQLKLLRFPAVQSKLSKTTVQDTGGHAFVRTNPTRPEATQEVEEDAIVDDGWGEEDAILDELNDVFEDNVDEDLSSNSKNMPEAQAKQPAVEGWGNVERTSAAGDNGGDTMPTRKRWLNPRPNRPYLYGLV
ncbi:MAG: hypothetical protein SGARI_007877 [Bacillariaceae sp.]